MAHGVSSRKYTTPTLSDEIETPISKFQLVNQIVQLPDEQVE